MRKNKNNRLSEISRAQSAIRGAYLDSKELYELLLAIKPKDENLLSERKKILDNLLSFNLYTRRYEKLLVEYREDILVANSIQKIEKIESRKHYEINNGQKEIDSNLKRVQFYISQKGKLTLSPF